MGTHKAELAQWRALAERQVAEVAYVKATAAHSEARINDLELALAALKDGGAGRSRDERKEGSAGKHEGPERRREGKKRKREATGKKEGLVDAAGHALVATGGVLPVETGNEVERQAAAQGVGNSSATCDTEAELKGLRTRVEALEAMSVVGGRTWEALIALWSEAVPDVTYLNLSGIPCVTNTALSKLRSLHSLTVLNHRHSSGFTDAGVRRLFSLTGLTVLDLCGTATTDAALEGIAGLRNL
ncbi:unnamed protein product [Closterium sp. NIES-64]|nr:unnamed protein product [Closterium sp. NIES-64]